MYHLVLSFLAYSCCFDNQEIFTSSLMGSVFCSIRRNLEHGMLILMPYKMTAMLFSYIFEIVQVFMLSSRDDYHRFCRFFQCILGVFRACMFTS